MDLETEIRVLERRLLGLRVRLRDAREVNSRAEIARLEADIRREEATLHSRRNEQNSKKR